MESSRAVPTAQELHLKVKTLQPATYEITTSAESTVQQLKQQLVSVSGIPADRQRLIFRGAVLQDGQLLHSQHVEDGHTLHLVERPEGIPPPEANSEPPGAQQRMEHRINIGMIDMNGAIAAAGGMTGFLQSLAGQMSNQHMQVVTHPPLGNQQGAPQVVQMMSMSGGPQVPQAPHQLTALNSYLSYLQRAPRPSTLPPFSMVSRIGQASADEAAFLNTARSALDGVNLPENLLEWMRNISLTDFGGSSRAAGPEADSAGNIHLPTQQTEGVQPGAQQARDPRRNGMDGSQGRPRPVTINNDMLRLSTLAVGQVARQVLAHIQTAALPSMAAAANRMREHVEQDTAHGENVLDQARIISNAAYELGSLLLELSLATTHLAQAASGNAGPLLCAQTGFLAPDGRHAHVTNRIPAPMPFMASGPVPVQARQHGGAAQAGQPVRPGAHSQLRAQTGPLPGPLPPSSEGGRPASTAARGMDVASPLAHAFFNAITDDETRTRHMRLPVRLPDGTSIRLDMASVVNALEAFILSAPVDVIMRTLSAALPGEAGTQQTLRTLMTARQTEEQRRQIYYSLTQPILQAAFDSICGYFQQVYRVASRQPGEQATIRPTRRASNRPVPSLTHPFASVPNPARDASRMSMEGREAQVPPAGMTPGMPSGQVQLEMSLEGAVELPAQLADLLGAAGLQQQLPMQAGATSGTQHAAGEYGTPAEQPVPYQTSDSAINPSMQPTLSSGTTAGTGTGAAAGPRPSAISRQTNLAHPLEPDSAEADCQTAHPNVHPQAFPELPGWWQTAAGQSRGDCSSAATPLLAAAHAGVGQPGCGSAGADPQPSLSRGGGESGTHSPPSSGADKGKQIAVSGSQPANGPAKGLGGGLPSLRQRTRAKGTGTTRAGMAKELHQRDHADTEKGRATTASSSTGATAPTSNDWSEFNDPRSGSKYYHNKATRETTWTRPAAFDPQTESAAASPQDQQGMPPQQSDMEKPEVSLQKPLPDSSQQQSLQTNLPGSQTNHRSTHPSPSGGSLMTMMNQMLQAPGMQQMLQSPQLQRLAESPAFTQITERFMGPDPSQSVVQASPTSHRSSAGPAAPDLGSMMQALMPLAQQFMGGGDAQAGSLQLEEQSIGSSPLGGEGRDSAGAAGASETGGEASRLRAASAELPELASLTRDDARRWQDIIISDRKKQRKGMSINASPLSAAYLTGVGQKGTNPSGGNSQKGSVADLD